MKSKTNVACYHQHNVTTTVVGWPSQAWLGFKIDLLPRQTPI